MWRRLLVDTLLAAGVAVILALIGISQSMPILGRVCELGGINELFIETPADFAAFSVSLGLAFALPPIIAWAVAMVARFFERSAPTPPELALYLGLPALAFGLGIFLQIWRIRDTMTTLRESPTDIAPAITMGSLELASAGASWCLAAGVLLAILVGLRGRVRAVTRP
jgi:hypothetical protein